MTNTLSTGEPRPLSEIESYHAHIYYDGASARERAALLRQWIAERFLVRIGNWHNRPVGPHPMPMFQVAFATELMSTFVPWLMLNRLGLTVLVHPNTDQPRDDHLVHALWLGGMLPLDVSMMPESLRAAGETNTPVEVNTKPRIDVLTRS
jgi:aromatic ring-cleaving dioxygenase